MQTGIVRGSRAGIRIFRLANVSAMVYSPTSDALLVMLQGILNRCKFGTH